LSDYGKESISDRVRVLEWKFVRGWALVTFN
jgi:hypothetical protein